MGYFVFSILSGWWALAADWRQEDSEVIARFHQLLLVPSQIVTGHILSPKVIASAAWLFGLQFWYPPLFSLAKSV